MSITSELRLFAADPYTGWVPTDKQQADLRAMADRIDAEHEAACAAAYGNGVESVALPDMTAYVKLPIDADGIPIHVGERVTCVLPFGCESEPFVVDRMELGRDGDGDVWSVALDRPTDCWEQPLLLRHRHAPTVEGLLREYALKCEEAGNSGPEVKRLAAEYAARLMLAGEDE